jgi:hypothetical protein
VLAHAEQAHLRYAIGLPTNTVLQAHVAHACEQAQRSFARHRQPLRRFRAFWYRAESWPAARRVCTKIEVSELGLNVRFVVTNRAGKPAAIFAWYNARGQAENFIKDLKPPRFCPKTFQLGRSSAHSRCEICHCLHDRL